VSGLIMDKNNSVDAVYALLARRDLISSWSAYCLAKTAIPDAEGATLLALHEAAADVLCAFLSELGEHGLQNQALWGVEPHEFDVQVLVDECASAWREVRRLRDAGVTSRALIDRYVGGWMCPIGSRDWLNRMRLGVSHRTDPGWVAHVRKLLEEEE
jgi:hypothetical protein